MTVDPVVLLTILGMAAITYATRVGGFLLLSRASLQGKLGAWLHYVPGAVLIAIVAPSVLPARLFGLQGGESGALTAGPAEAIAALVTAAIAARFKNLLLAMLAGVATVWLLRRLFG
ncbi:MAG: AzlD domain-containing protein [Chloroflexia bacterium]